MQNEFKDVKLHFDKGEKVISIEYFELYETTVDVKSLVDRYKQGCLLIREHKFLQTQFLMMGAEACHLMIFDERGEFISTRIHNGNAGAPFSSFISDMFVLLLPPQSELLELKIHSMEILVTKYDILCKNKYGVYESLGDQCCRSTCTCAEGCRLDDMIFEDSYLHDVYLANMRRHAKKEDKRE